MIFCLTLLFTFSATLVEVCTIDMLSRLHSFYENIKINKSTLASVTVDILWKYLKSAEKSSLSQQMSITMVTNLHEACTF